MKKITKKTIRLLLLLACCGILFDGCKKSHPGDEEPVVQTEQKGEEEIEDELSDDPCGSQKKWDWTKAESFAHAYISGALGPIRLSNPFLTNASPDLNISNIIRARDYLPEQGWVLLAKVFGCPNNYAQTRYPYFMLYNKYTGMVRMFVFNGNYINHQQAVATIGWEMGSDKNALFASSEVYRSANEEYHAGKIKANSLVNYITNYYSDAWFVTEMPLNFDPGMAYKDNLVLRFRITSEVVEEQKLGIDFKFDTRTITTNAEEKQSGLRKSYEFLQKGQKYLTSAPSNKQMNDHFDKIEGLLHPNRYEGHKRLLTEGIKPYKEGKLATALKSVSGIATAISGPLGAGLNLFSSFFGKSNSGGTQAVNMLPTMSVGSGTIKGEISITTNATSFPLQLPGSNHKYANGEVNIDGLPVYDKPLGVISLEKTPRVATKNADLTKDYQTAIQEGISGLAGADDNYNVSGHYVHWKYHYCQIPDDIHLAFNTNSDTEIVAIKARLIARHNTVYDTEDLISLLVTKRIELGEYELVEPGTGWFTYGTRLMDIEQFRNARLLISEGKRVSTYDPGDKRTAFFPDNALYLQLVVVLKPTDPKADPTPAVHSMTYLLDRNKTMDWSEASTSNALVLTKY